MKRLVLITSLILIAFCCHAQQGEIIYLDFDPDSIVYYPTDKLYIDFDQDGDPDAYLYTHATSGGWWFDVYSFTDWELRWCEDTITPINEFNDNWGIGFNLLPPTQYERFAVRHLTDSGYYYGWVKVLYGVYWWQDKNGGQVSGWHSKGYLILDKQCFCTIPDYPLRWGQTDFTGIEELGESLSFASVHPNPTTGLVTVTGENLSQAEVFNMLGQQVLNVKGEGDELRIDMAALPAGIYFVNVTDEEGRKCVRKVVKE